MSTPDTSSTAADLAAVTDTVERSRERIARIAEPYLRTDREDVVTALYEAERQLRSAERSLQRSLKLLAR